MPQDWMHIQATMGLITMQIKRHAGDRDMHENSGDKKTNPERRIKKAMNE